MRKFIVTTQLVCLLLLAVSSPVEARRSKPRPIELPDGFCAFLSAYVDGNPAVASFYFRYCDT